MDSNQRRKNEDSRYARFVEYSRLRIKRIVAWCIRHILQALFFLPVKKNRILFSGLDGKYCCNPKYVSEYLIGNWGKDLDVIWGFSHPKEYKEILGIKAVRINSPAWFYYTATSSVVVSCTSFSQLQPKRKGQLLINTWHGGGAYKRVSRGNLYIRSRLENRITCENAQRIDLFLSSSRSFTEYAVRQDLSYSGVVLPCGMPRNDLFFDQKKRNATSESVRASLGISGYIVVYAPTFRGKYSKGYRTCSYFPYQNVLSAVQKRFGEPAVILKRAHPGGIMADGLEDNVVDVTDYPDMQELLCAADMLITDYSSSMWDFALMGRPCLLYMPDLEDYKATRGICTPPEEWPGIVCRNEDDLIYAISTIDEQVCAERASRHLEVFGSYETGTATVQVCERILRHMSIKRESSNSI